MTVGHWVKPNTLRDILWQAWRADAAEPTAIRVRPELHTRMLADMTAAAREATIATGVIGQPYGLLLIVDDRLPQFPGYEVHRKPPIPTPRTGE